MMCAMDSDEDWVRLGEVAAARRDELGRTQIEVAQRGGLSLDRVSAVERGEARGMRARTMRALDRGLDWHEGSVRAVLSGGQPKPVPGTRVEASATLKQSASMTARGEVIPREADDADLDRRPGETPREYHDRIRAELERARAEVARIEQAADDLMTRLLEDRDAG